MRRKRRTTVYVRPGKDVTLYVPSDTPPEVIDYLNSLKQEGIFSQGVMEIVTRYVRQQHFTGRSIHPPMEVEDVMDPGVQTGDRFHRIAEDEEGQSEADQTEVERDSLEVEYQATAETHGNTKLDLSQIFQRAQRNSGKIRKNMNAEPNSGGGDFPLG